MLSSSNAVLYWLHRQSAATETYESVGGLRVVDLLEDVLEPAIIFLQDGVLGRHKLTTSSEYSFDPRASD